MRPVSAKHRVAVIAAENTFKSPSRCQIINYENTIFYSILCSSHIIILIKYRIGMWLWLWCCVSQQFSRSTHFLRLFQCFDRQIISDCFNFDRILREVHLLSNSGTNGGSSGTNGREDERRKSGLHINLTSQSVFKKVFSKSVVESSNCDDWRFLWKL